MPMFGAFSGTSSSLDCTIVRLSRAKTAARAAVRKWCYKLAKMSRGAVFGAEKESNHHCYSRLVVVLEYSSNAST